MENRKSIYEALTDSRIILLNGEINRDCANAVIANLLYLDSMNHEDIYIYINSEGGDVLDGMSIIDTMDYISSNVNTVACGIAASMAAVILSAGAKRYALKHSRIMIHQAIGGMYGKMSDLTVSYNNMIGIKDSLMEMFAGKTGKTVEQLEKDCEKDNWMDTSSAREYGIIDEILEKKDS